ncbi:MAG: serine protease [Pedobacter sp.]|nr:MAG: serine protease [Pedobacter sp.]
MTEKLMNKPCVRIKIVIDQKLKSYGSGCLIKGVNGYFIITAYHCIYGDNNIFKDVNADQILIESQAFYNSSFEKIEVVEIVASDEKEDWALLKVNYNDLEGDFPEILTSDNFRVDMPVTFTGFQVVNTEHCRTFKSRVLNGISEYEFRITLSAQDKFKGGSDDAVGLSGSGAFIINDGIHIINCNY